MKRTRKILCMLLVFMMLLSSCILLPLNVAGAEPIENLYDVDDVEYGEAPKYSYDDYEVTFDRVSSPIITVAEGDVITVGPVLQNDNWFIRTYDEDCESIRKVIPDECEVVEKLRDNVAILSFTVPKGAKYLCVTNNQMFFDCTLVTKNRVYSAEEYFSYMSGYGVSVDFLRPAASSGETLENLFPARSNATLRGYVSGGTFTENSYYRSRRYTDFEVGDVFYIAAVNQGHDHSIDIVNENGKGQRVLINNLVLYEDLGRNYAIYAYRVRPETREIAFNIGVGVYDDQISLVTKNQAFSGEQYRAMFNIDLEEDILDENSPLYGLTGLFIGDSISRGSHDYISYLDHHEEAEKRVSWAGGISARTGLISTNPSVSGARVSYREDVTDGGWVYKQMVPYIGQRFDIVVMQGGVNDCKSRRQPLGSILPETSTGEQLEAALKDGSYLSGLQWTFYNARGNFPTATLFFVANYKLATSPNHEPLGEYLAAAKALCEMYGVHYIDLYNNEELTERLEFGTLYYIEDKVHPNRAGYEIVTPYIQAEIERVMAEKQAMEQETTGEKVENSDNDPDDPTTDPSGGGETAADSEKGKGCGSVVTASVGLLSIALLPPAMVVLRKREE